MTAIVKDKVRRSFSCHAGDYDDLAVVQKRVVEKFVTKFCAETFHPDRLLDVGTGTGRLLDALGRQYPHAELFGADLALGMVKESRSKSGVASIVCSDAEQLPFRDSSFQMVVSTSTYQWLENLDAAFAEAYRLLVQGGRFCFAFFGGETLHELRSSYRSGLSETGSLLPDRSHRFFTIEQASEALKTAGFTEVRLEPETEVEYYQDVKTVLASIKGVGAGTASGEKGKGLSGRRVIECMIRSYENEFRTLEGVPATYEVFYGSGVK